MTLLISLKRAEERTEESAKKQEEKEEKTGKIKAKNKKKRQTMNEKENLTSKKFFRQKESIDRSPFAPTGADALSMG